MNRLNVGLLYQGNETDWIWGSAVTTAHLQRAFEEKGHSTWRTSVTHPKYQSREDVPFIDLLILEGVPAHKVPQVVWERSVVKVFWWLSDLFYDLDTVQEIGFDAIATNSAAAESTLRATSAMVRRIDLAAPRDFARASTREDYRSFCTYLGGYPHKSEEQMDLLLAPAMEFGLALWGCGWEDSKFHASHRGVLPFGNIGALYRSSTVVLALTEERQKRRGMINNRIYEAMAAGSIVVSERYNYLEQHPLGEFTHFVRSPEEAKALLREIHEQPEPFHELALRGQEAVLRDHTYSSRVDQFLTFHGLARKRRDLARKR